MSLRVIACFATALFICYVAWKRNWFTGLCYSVVFMAFLEHPDMPRSILGIQGLNLWNLVYLNIFLAWRRDKIAKGRRVDVDATLKKAVLLYVAVIVVSCIRLLIDPTRFYQASLLTAVVDYFVNPIKFLLPGLLLYDGCRTPVRAKLAVGAIVLSYLILALMVIKYVGIHLNTTGKAFEKRAYRIIQKQVGYNRVDMSMMLAGASWAMVAYSQFQKRMLPRVILIGCAGAILLGQALTGGRTGYLTWGLVGLFLAFTKWRKLLPIIPLGAATVLLLLPGVRERMLEGISSEHSKNEGDVSEITSGRSTIWPHVIAKIKESPILGYGRLGMTRTGTATWLLEELSEVFAHPHNAYMEMLLDGGIIGLACVTPIFYLAFRRSLTLFLDKRSKHFEAVGGAALSLLLALLFGALGAQTLYPREGVVWMWAAIGVSFRVYAERERLKKVLPAENPWLMQSKP